MFEYRCYCMPRPGKCNKERAIGMLDAGVSQCEVVRRFGVHGTLINRLVSRVINAQTTDLVGHAWRHMFRNASFDYVR